MAEDICVQCTVMLPWLSFSPSLQTTYALAQSRRCLTLWAPALGIRVQHLNASQRSV